MVTGVGVLPAVGRAVTCAPEVSVVRADSHPRHRRDPAMTYLTHLTAPLTALSRDAEAGALRAVVATFGVIVAIAGAEHGVGEILEGPIAPSGVVIESWPDTRAFEILSGEPTMTIVPNLLVSGVLTITISIVFATWAVGYAHRPRGGLVLAGLSVVLLLVGGGFAPPLIGLILGLAATRIGVPSAVPGRITRRFARVWRWALGAGVVGYLGLFPGMVLASAAFGIESEALVGLLALLAFGGLLGSLVAARAHDRVVADSVIRGETRLR